MNSTVTNVNTNVNTVTTTKGPIFDPFKSNRLTDITNRQLQIQFNEPLDADSSLSTIVDDEILTAINESKAKYKVEFDNSGLDKIRSKRSKKFERKFNSKLTEENQISLSVILLLQKWVANRQYYRLLYKQPDAYYVNNSNSNS